MIAVAIVTVFALLSCTGSAWGEMAGGTQTLVDVPSGQQVTWLDTIQDQPGASGLTIRFRFLAPAIARDGGTVDFDAAAIDMQYLCDSFALQRLPAIGPKPAQIIISLSDRPVIFGTPNPDATQFFEGYRPEGGLCIWEPL